MARVGGVRRKCNFPSHLDLFAGQPYHEWLFQRRSSRLLQTRAVDMFSSGLVAHYVIHGVHPYDPAATAVDPNTPMFFVRREVRYRFNPLLVV